MTPFHTKDQIQKEAWKACEKSWGLDEQ